MPDATGLELIAQEVRKAHDGAILDTAYFRERAALHVAPAAVPDVLEHLRAKGYRFLASVHGLDYFPEEPRLGVQYELLDMDAVDRITVKTRVALDDPHVPSVTPAWPEDYEGHPQRRDFPLGGEPVLFTHNEPRTPGWWRK